MSYTEDLAEEIIDFIIEKTRDLSNFAFKDVMQEVSNNIDAQIEALEESEEN